MTYTLTETRKADRIKMAQIVAELARKCGAEAEIRPEIPGDDFRDRRTVVAITAPRHVGVAVEFRGNSPQSQPNTFVLSWHIDSTRSDARFDPSFKFDAVNRHHHTKATSVCYGFDELLDELELRLLKCRDGDAFSPELEAQHIAQHGTAAQRQARWDRIRAEEEAARAAQAVA